MKTHIIGTGVVYIDLSVQEHLVLAAAVRRAVAQLSDDRIEARLGLPPDDARDFAYSIRMLEGSARADGTDWLGPSRPLDGAVTPESPALTIVFAEDGSAWRLSTDQLWFAEACAVWASTDRDSLRRGGREYR